MITFLDFIKDFSTTLAENGVEEGESIVAWLLEERMGIQKKDWFKPLPDQFPSSELQNDLNSLKSGKPIQHILGSAPFYTREFLVTEDTLIPRNETEELVHWILRETWAEGAKFLDIGTGTGCIPITLQLENPALMANAVDVSKKALEVSEANCSKLRAEVNFQCLDILNEIPDYKDLDFVVSNPPYVLESDKAMMKANVLDFEPDLALFVEDHEPLKFYERIADLSRSLLKKEGKLYFEIHENFGQQMTELLRDLGYINIETKKDLNGKDRMARATWPA